MPKSLIKAITAVQDAAQKASQVVDDTHTAAGIGGPVSISNEIGNADPKISLRNQNNLSNHAKLALHTLISKLEQDLRTVKDELAQAFPGNSFVYSFDVNNAKHDLTIAGHLVLTAIAKTWAQQIPMIQKVFPTEDDCLTWLIDWHYMPGKDRFHLQNIVKAPTLADAIMRYSYTQMSLGDRRARNISAKRCFAAARLTEASTAAASSRHHMDNTEIRIRWEALTSDVEALPILPSSDLHLKLVSRPGQKDVIKDTSKIHLLLAAGDVEACDDIITHAQALLLSAARDMRTLAPTTPFELHLGRSPHHASVEFSVGANQSREPIEIIRFIRDSEAAGADAPKLHAVVDDWSVDIISARTGAEARQLLNDPYGHGRPITNIFEADPVSSKAVQSANEMAKTLLEASLAKR